MLRALYVYDVSLSLDLRVRRECLMLANVTEYPSVDGRWLGGIVLMQQLLFPCKGIMFRDSFC